MAGGALVVNGRIGNLARASRIDLCMRQIVILACTALLAGCQPAAYGPVPPPPYQGEPAACPIIGSSDWAAWVNAMPGPNAGPRLIATGKVVTPTGGYRIAFDRDLIVRESYPVQAVATLRVTPPTNGAIQAVITQTCGQLPDGQPVGPSGLRRKVLAHISPVQTAP